MPISRNRRKPLERKDSSAAVASTTLVAQRKRLPKENQKKEMGSKGKMRRDVDSKIGLFMECEDEDLSEAQLSAFNSAMSHYRETSNNIDTLLRAGLVDVIERGQDYIALEIKEGLNGINGPKSKQAAPVTSRANVPTVPGPGPVVQSSPLIIQNPGMPQVSATSTYQLVMDPRSLGLYVSSTSSPGTGATVGQMMAGVIQSTASAISTPVMSTTALRPNIPGPSAIRSSLGRPMMRPQTAARPTRPTRPSAPTRPSGPTRPTLATPALVPLSELAKNKVNGNRTPVQIRPGSKPIKANEANSVGGLVQRPATSTKSGPAMVVDLTEDEAARQMHAPDSREIMINKLSGKTYPSLVVVARPHLRTKEFTQQQMAQERAELDAKMKAVLMGSATNFTEWLIQTGIVRSDQCCSVHVNTDLTTVKLKLGMYSDVSKFPYSGGYVWISECCPQRFVSVFSGSLFEGAPHAPTVLVKLLYHWSCQTSVNNISSWVKVDGLYVKSFYTNIRAICTAAIHEKFEKLGGPKRRVELGVISLGTTSQDGNMRQVKVEVLGCYDPDTKLIRLRAVEPLTDGERNYKKRFVKILEPLEEWVHKDSVILTDFTVDKGTLQQMGFQSIYQVSLAEQQNSSAKYSNIFVMDYLRRIVPRMFQNTLSLLSRPIIQQFLDELVWRERWGFIPARAFANIITHLSEQTKLDTGDTLVARLQKISANPFKHWGYQNWQMNCADEPTTPSTRMVVGTNNTITLSQPSHPMLPPSPALPSIDNLPPSLRHTEAPSPPPSQGQKRSRKKQHSPLESDPKRRPTVITAVSNNQKLRPLDSYYYGKKSGDPHIVQNQKHFDLNHKCAMCHMVIKDNLKMMRHLIGHAYNEGSYSFCDTSPQCRYCLKDFLSDLALQNHVDEAHERGGLTCLICRETNRDRTTLILHMHHNHVEAELPYQCGICHFRSSQHNAVIDHFHEVHKQTDKLQCPFCLRIVNLQTVDGRRITQNQYFFMHHIQKHQRKTLIRKCHKCVLWFVHKDLIKEHFTKDHVSCRDMVELERYPADGLEVVMMPMPNNSDTVLAKQQTKSKLAQSLPGNFTVNNFTGLKLESVKTGDLCSECEGEFLAEDHFTGYLSCLKCRFSTCCNKAMTEHCAIYHDPRQPKPVFNVGKTILLDKPLHCVCGFSSRSGNKLARHLADCKRKSAYPSAERAAQCTLQGQSASFPPLVNLDDEGDSEDHEEKWMRAFTQSRQSADSSETASTSRKDSPSMLNVLGLVRKPSTDENSPEADVVEIDN